MTQFDKLVQSFRVERLREQLKWIRWIVPIEAGLLGLTVSLSKLDNSLAHDPPELLRWAWVALCLSVASGALFALSPYALHDTILKEVTKAKESQKIFDWANHYNDDPHREIPLFLRYLQWVSLAFFLLSLALLTLYAVMGVSQTSLECGG